MASLSDAQKALIVQRLATFVSHSEIVAELQTHGVAVSLPHIAYYDPESKGTKVAQKWRDLFTETRAEFIKSTARIAISHKSFRLRELDRLYRKTATAARPNVPLAKELLVEAEKFMGEAYTNRRVLVPGDPLSELAKTLGYTPEQLAALLSAEDAEGLPEMGTTA